MCRGFNIAVEKMDDGFSMYTCRDKDKFVLVDEWNPNIKSKNEAIKECKITIDDYFNNPSDYE